jgi:hypothetical protein
MNESKDSVTSTPKIDLLRWKNRGDGALTLAVCAPPLRFDVVLLAFFDKRKLKFLLNHIRPDTYRIDKSSLMAAGHREEVMAKIVQFHEKGGPEVLKLEDVTLLPVAENDVRFRVHAIGLNRAESMYRK